MAVTTTEAIRQAVRQVQAEQAALAQRETDRDRDADLTPAHPHAPPGKDGIATFDTTAERETPPPAHPDQPALDALAGRIRDLHAEHAVSLATGQADNAAAALYAQMRRYGMTEAARVGFSVHADSQQPNPAGNLMAYSHHPLREYSAVAAVPVATALHTPVDTILQALDQARQQRADLEREWQQQRERANAQEPSHGPGAGGPGMTPG